MPAAIRSVRILRQEQLLLVVGNEADTFLDETIPLVTLPSPYSFRKISTERLDKMKRKWEILFAGTSIANIQATVQAGIGLGLLLKGAIREGIRKAPAHLNLPELTMYSILLITDDRQDNVVRDVFVSYLEAWKLNWITCNARRSVLVTNSATGNFA